MLLVDATGCQKGKQANMAAAARFMPLCMFKAIRSCGLRYSSSFQSVYSLNKLYPDSESRQYTEPRQEQPDIPVDRLSISYSKSSGPGGQNVNKVNTKAEVRFHLGSADWIPEDVKQKLSVQYKNRLNKDGEFIVVSDVSRYQMRNLADCLQKIRAMISDASKRPNAVTKETAEFHRMRTEIMNKERLKQKKTNSSIKQSRRVDLD